MPYIKRTVRAGNTIEIYKYHSSRYGCKNKPRGEIKAETTEMQAKLNDIHAREKLRWLINNNFGLGDYHMILTYRRENRPPPDAAKEMLRRFTRSLRKLYRDFNNELKYIEVTEYLTKAVHHHFCINHFDVSQISALWEYGSVYFVPFYTLDCKDLGAYFLKETEKSFAQGLISGKRWNASRNLKQPKIEREVVAAESWTDTPKIPKGYYLDKDSYVADVNSLGYAYQRYTLIKLQPPKEKRNRRKLCNAAKC